MAHVKFDSTGGQNSLYDEHPYESMPFAQTQPANLAALGMLFGLNPPPVINSRVLEIGCAAGGNIIPLASRFPASRFDGLDISARHVDMANSRIKAIGLTNIAIRLGDIADPTAVDGEFDYIICHGVYSWVPEHVRRRILEVFRQHLTPNGIAYVSYNILPGWHLRELVRDVFRSAAKGCSNQAQIVAAGRKLLDQLASISSESTPYGQLLRNEVRQIAPMPDSYIIAEFLAEENEPCYFRDFLSEVREAGLEYLCETELHASLRNWSSPDYNRTVQSIAGPDPLEAEQIFDLAQGRQFRQSLLVRADNPETIDRAPGAARLAGHHFATALRIAPELTKGDEVVLRDPGGRTITTNDRAVAVALDRLGVAAPATHTLPELVAMAKIGPTESKAVAGRLLETLLRVVVAGLVKISAAPLRSTRATAEHPEVWSNARIERTEGQVWITNLQHQPLRLDPLAYALLPFVDGNNNRSSLTALLLELAAHRMIDPNLLSRMPETQVPSAKPAAVAAALVELVLAQLERLALLEPEN